MGALAARQTIDARRWGIAAALALLAILLVRNLGQMLQFATLAIGYPYDFDYGEGIVWQQMRNIVAGEGYGPLGVFPAIVYHYPPVYHLLTAGVAALAGLDQLAAGRLISAVSTLVMAALAGLIAADAMPPDERPAVRRLCGLVGGLALLSCNPVMTWSALMRVDMLACALTLTGLFLAVRAQQRPGAAVLAGIAFVLAIYTKQTAVAAPAAAFLGLLLARPRAAAMMLATIAALGLAALALLYSASDGGILRHMLLYNINRLDLLQVTLLGEVLSGHAVFIVVAGIGVRACWLRVRPAGKGAAMLVAWRRRLTDEPPLVALAILLLFLLLKSLMLVLILKSGSSDNYLIEWFCAVAIFVGVGIAPAIRVALGHSAQSPILLAALVFGLSLQAVNVPGWDVTPEMSRERTASLIPLVERIRLSAKPVISDEMVLILRAGKPVQWEPAITSELAHSGLYDEAAFIKMVREREFGFFITRMPRGSRLYSDRYSPAVADAIDAAYPRKETIAGLFLHLPRR